MRRSISEEFHDRILQAVTALLYCVNRIQAVEITYIATNARESLLSIKGTEELCLQHGFWYIRKSNIKLWKNHLERMDDEWLINKVVAKRQKKCRTDTHKTQWSVKAEEAEA